MARSVRARLRGGLCDVDRFKLYNDRYGHPAGDDALRAVCRTIASTVRSGDMTYRYGGEELLVIMPEQTAETSMIAMERVRAAVERLAIPHPRNLPYGVVTISIGLVTIGSGEQRPWEAVLYQADEALYRTKEDGRNRVMLADPPLLGLSRDLDLSGDVIFSALGAVPPPTTLASPGRPDLPGAVDLTDTIAKDDVNLTDTTVIPAGDGTPDTPMPPPAPDHA